MKLIIFCLVALMACSQKPRLMKPLEVYGMLQNEFAILIDLREKSHITAERSKKFTIQTILRDEPKWHSFISSVSKDKTLVFFGKNSKMIATHIAIKGWKSGYFLDFAEWQNQELPTIKSR